MLESTADNAPFDATVEANKIIAEIKDVADTCWFERKKKKTFNDGCKGESFNLSKENWFRISLLTIFEEIVNELETWF